MSDSFFRTKWRVDVYSWMLSFDKGKGSKVWKEASKWLIALHVGKDKQWERIICYLTDTQKDASSFTENLQY